MMVRIIVAVALVAVMVITTCLWAFKPPAISSESMGRPYVVERIEDNLIITLDESDWEYRGEVEYYQFVYRKEEEEFWTEETPMGSKLTVIPGVSPGETYEIRVDGLNKHKEKIGQSDTLTYGVIDKEETEF